MQSDAESTFITLAIAFGKVESEPAFPFHRIIHADANHVTPRTNAPYQATTLAPSFGRLKLMRPHHRRSERSETNDSMAKRREEAKSQRQKVTDAIQRGILNGELSPGASLRQIPLSQEHGVSQSVIRESLQTLERHGLVTGVDKLGYVVRKLGVRELVDAYRVREVLEGLAARLCCRKASRDDIDSLRELAQQIHAKSGKKSRATRSDLEYKFHQHFLTLSGNETLQRVSVGYRFVGNLVVTDRNPDQLLHEHVAIVEAVADDQPDEAERLARLHVANSADSIMNVDA